MDFVHLKGVAKKRGGQIRQEVRALRTEIIGEPPRISIQLLREAVKKPGTVSARAKTPVAGQSMETLAE